MPLLRPRVLRPEPAKDGRKSVSAENADTYISAITKWIPVEVIGAYQFILGMVPINRTGFRFWGTIAFVPLTALWIAFATTDKPTNPKQIAWRQVILAACAFVAWVAGTQSDLVHGVISTWEAWMGSVVLGLSALFLPLGDRILQLLGLPQNPVT